MAYYSNYRLKQIEKWGMENFKQNSCRRKTFYNENDDNSLIDICPNSDFMIYEPRV